MKALDLFIVHQ